MTDNEGATATATVGVTSTVNQAPVAVANATRIGTKAPLLVEFSSEGSVDNDGSIASYNWDFGDGTATSSSANPSHTYATEGTFSATLTVTDNEGGTDVKSVSINVAAVNLAPVPVVTATPRNGRAPRGVLVSVRPAAPCRCVPVNSDVEAVKKTFFKDSQMDYPKNQRVKTAYTPRSRAGKGGKYPRSYSDSANRLVFYSLVK